MDEETIIQQLTGEAIYAQKSMSRDLLFEIYGKAEMARQLKAITFTDFMGINEMTIHFINTHAVELEHAERRVYVGKSSKDL